jgi:hypothetical protein
MNLQEKYPRVWEDLMNKKVPKKEINEYLLKFVARLLKEVKENKRNEIDLGDGFSMGRFAMVPERGYQLSHFVENFLKELGNYGLEISGEKVESHMNSPKEVEIELKKVSKKVGIMLDL